MIRKLPLTIHLPNLLTYLNCLLKWGITVCLLGMALILVIDLTMGYMVRDKIYTDIKQLPQREYALVLGTAKYYVNGAPNLYYKYRLAAANTLIKQKKVNILLLSGDNQTPYYNEPKMMTEDLRKMGVKTSQLQQDYAGYSTLDSILRAKQVLKIPPFIIVSQRFHCERALFIAQFHGIDALCYTAKYPENHYQVRIREFFARPLTLIRLLLGVSPTSLEESKIIERKNA